jgi:hypothetical protein
VNRLEEVRAEEGYHHGRVPKKARIWERKEREKGRGWKK